MARESDLSRLIRRKRRRKKKRKEREESIDPVRRRALSDAGLTQADVTKGWRKARIRKEGVRRANQGQWPGAFIHSDSPVPKADRYLPDQGTRPKEPSGALGRWGIRPKNLMAPFTPPGRESPEGTLVLPRGIESDQFINKPQAFPDIWKTALQKEYSGVGQAPSERIPVFDPGREFQPGGEEDQIPWIRESQLSHDRPWRWGAEEKMPLGAEPDVQYPNINNVLGPDFLKSNQLIREPVKYQQTEGDIFDFPRDHYKDIAPEDRPGLGSPYIRKRKQQREPRKIGQRKSPAAEGAKEFARALADPEGTYGYDPKASWLDNSKTQLGAMGSSMQDALTGPAMRRGLLGASQYHPARYHPIVAALLKEIGY